MLHNFRLPSAVSSSSIPDYLAGAFFAAALILVPVTSVPLWLPWGGTVYVFEFPKLIVLLAAVLLGWSALLISLRSWSLAHIAARVMGRGFGGLTTLLGVGILAATISGAGDRSIALIGTSERLDGAIPVLLILHAGQLAAVLVAQGRSNMHRVVTLALLGAALASTEIIMQAAGWHPWTLIEGVEYAGGPITGAFGHPGFATIYLASVFAFGVGHFMSEPIRVNAPQWVLLALTAVGLSIPAGRAGVLAAIGTIGLLVLAGLFMRNRPFAIRAALGGVTLIAALAVTPIVNDYARQRITRLASEPSSDNSLQQRFVTWQLAPTVIALNPAFGAGTGAFADLVWEVASPEQKTVLLREFMPWHLIDDAIVQGRVAAAFDPNTGTLHSRVMNYDKAHNYFLDLGVQFGLVGLALFMAWWFVVMWRGVLRLKVAPALFGLTISYLSAQQFFFATPIVDIGVFILIGACMAGQTSTNRAP